jgi:hypothetical protein
MAKKKTAKKKTAKRHPVRRTVRRQGKRAPKGYAYVVKLGDDYLTGSGDYSSSQPDARRFMRRPGDRDLVRVTGDRRKPRIVKLHLRQS